MMPQVKKKIAFNLYLRIITAMGFFKLPDPCQRFEGLQLFLHRCLYPGGRDESISTGTGEISAGQVRDTVVLIVVL